VLDLVVDLGAWPKVAVFLAHGAKRVHGKVRSS
jgi:hypothetical protein